MNQKGNKTRVLPGHLRVLLAASQPFIRYVTKRLATLKALEAMIPCSECGDVLAHLFSYAFLLLALALSTRVMHTHSYRWTSWQAWSVSSAPSPVSSHLAHTPSFPTLTSCILPLYLYLSVFLSDFTLTHTYIHTYNPRLYIWLTDPSFYSLQFISLCPSFFSFAPAPTLPEDASFSVLHLAVESSRAMFPYRRPSFASS